MFTRLRAFFSFPLLAKELTETAARRRTYVLRVVYAVLLYGFFAYNLPVERYNNREYGMTMLGLGQQVFETVLQLQLFGLVLFLPAFMSGRITQEKERDSLAFLLLTDLRPWSIVWQKYVGGLVPMFSFLLLGLPLAGVAYALGGLSTITVMQATVALLVACLQIGALAIFCSAWCRTTVGAFILTYVLGVIMYAGPRFLLGVISTIADLHGELGISRSDLWYPLERYTFFHTPAMYAMTGPDLGPLGKFAYGIPLLLVLFWLGLARVFLVRRAFLRPANFLPWLFGWLDRFMKLANRLTGGFVFWHDVKSTPGDEPIFWRETQRRALGKAHYLIRLLYAVEIPTVLLAMAFGSIGGASGQNIGLSVLFAILSALAVLILAVHGVNSLVTERVDQTLEVLLTTPLSASSIVRQKDHALRRLQLVVAAPLLTVMACEARFEAYLSGRTTGSHWVLYALCGVLMIAIYLPLVTWLSLWIGLRARNRIRAILTILAVLSAWCAFGPFVLGHFDGPWRYLALLSPLTVGLLNESGRLFTESVFEETGGALIIANTLIYLMLAIFVRARLYATAERGLRAA